MSNGRADLRPAALQAFAATLGGNGGSSAELASADAQAALATALVQSLVQVNSKALAECMFLIEYMGPQAGGEFVQLVFAYKRHQAPGAMRRIVDAIKALSLSEFMRGVNVNLGGK